MLQRRGEAAMWAGIDYDEDDSDYSKPAESDRNSDAGSDATTRHLRSDHSGGGGNVEESNGNGGNTTGSRSDGSGHVTRAGMNHRSTGGGGCGIDSGGYNGSMESDDEHPDDNGDDDQHIDPMETLKIGDDEEDDNYEEDGDDGNN